MSFIFHLRILQKCANDLNDKVKSIFLQNNEEYKKHPERYVKMKKCCAKITRERPTQKE